MISILTSTYNRKEKLKKLYESLARNSKTSNNFEWLIIDDGSSDNTKEEVQKFIEEKKINVKYFYQENSGKMAGINKLVDIAKGDIMFTCDSDDELTDDAITIIEKYSNKLLKDKNAYGLCFLKIFKNGKISGGKFKSDLYKSTIFNLYFKEKIGGEKTLVFKSSIRKKYKYELEKDEKFVTEESLYHKIEKDGYYLICINKPIEIIEYQENGYSKDYLKTFKKYPKGYYKYFKEILELADFKNADKSKKMYVYKHYILFSYLSKEKHPIKNIKRLKDKIIICILWVPGTIKSKKMFDGGNINGKK